MSRVPSFYKEVHTPPSTFSSGIQIISSMNFYKVKYFRDKSGEVARFEPIALVEHQGYMSDEGQTQGHYICDLKDIESKTWFRSNDNQNPIPISLTNVTKKPVVVLYKKIYLS